jgi:CHAT domain-containing protein/Flp pilus assembly protein TadD
MISLNARDLFCRYQLGEATDEERRKIEEGSLVSHVCKERVRLAEAELFAAYVTKRLSAYKRERFEKHFLRSDERLEKLRLAELLYERAKTGMAKFPDASNPFYDYFVGNLTPDENLKVEKRRLDNNDYGERFDVAEREMIVAYTLEDPTGVERKRFQRYLFSSEEKMEKLRFAEAVYEYYAYIERVIEAQEGAIAMRLDRFREWLAEPVRYWNLSRPIWQPLAAVSIATLSVFIWMSFFHQSALDIGLLKLGAAYAEGRPVEARISDFGYATYPGKRDGDSVSYNRSMRGEADRLITNAAASKENKSATEYYALGKLFLAEGDFNQAADYFSLALKQDDRNAKFYNDLAVALMAKEKARTPGESTGEAYAEAVEYLHRALALAPSLHEAQFNLALCQQYQMLLRQAADGWRKYLEKDPNSKWAEEARNHLRDIEDLIKATAGNREQLRKEFREAALRRDGELAWQTFRNSRTVFGGFIISVVIDDYLSARLTGRTADAETALQILLFIGDIERDKTGDRYTYDMANFYRGAGPQQLQKAAEARVLFKSAAESIGKSLLGEAVSKLRQAQAIFNQIGNTSEALLAQYLLGHCYRVQGSVKLSLDTLTQGAQDCEAKSYPWLLATYHNGLRNAHVDLTEYSKAIEDNQELIANAKRVEADPDVRLGLQGASEIYMFLGRYRESLQAAQEGLAMAARLRATPNNFVTFYILASKSYMGLGKLGAALDYQQEGVKLSLEINDPDLTSRHHVNLGLVFNKLGRHNEAIEAIRKAAEIGKSVRDEKKSGEIIAFSNRYLGHIYRDMGRYEESARAYQEASQFYSENDIDNTVLLFETAKGKLLTAMRGGDDATAAKELERVIDFYEQHRVNIEDEISRNSFFDREQGIYDIAVDFAYSRQQNERLAFDYSELNRARSLLDTVELPERKLPEGPLPEVRLPTSTKPLSLDQIQARMPDRTYLLQYAALDDKLVIWAVSKNDLKSQVVSIGQEQLSSKVTAYLESLGSEWKGRRSDPKPQATDLYKILIEPIESQLNRDFEICVIPDKILHRLPFAALISPRTGKYLIEERTIYVSPSANMFLVATEIAGRKVEDRTERLLAVGNPQVDRKRFPRLTDLPNAASQAWEEAAFYEAKLVVLNGKAREAYIRQEIEKSDVVDFAMHYVADERTPMLSLLPLAAEKAPASKAQDGMLYAHELYRMNLSRLRLAILSGCQTGIETFYKGEGAISLARAFQAAGVPLVVASLWGVEDRRAKELMVTFHRYRKQRGLTTAQALRQAQLDQITSADPQARSPYHWAAYIVIGGRADF